jgi:thiamine pyrophosphate-dependent acetolactate synthase large subunit-like protein
MVLLCGDTRAEDRDGFQKIAQREIILSAGAGFEQLRAPATLAQDLASALRRAVAERRPIALNMPVELQWQDVDYQPWIARHPDQRAIVPESEDLDNAIGIIAAAKRPVVLAGRGARGAAGREALLRLAERIGAPVATTLKGKGLFDGAPFDLGVCGTLSSSVAIDILIESDCLIAFGASLNKYTLSEGALAKGKRLVQVTLDPADIGRHCPVDAGIHGDAARTADLFVHWLDAAEIEGSGYRDAAMRARLDAHSIRDDFEPAGPAMDLREVLARVNEAVPADRVFVTDVGRYVGWAWKLIDVPDPNSFVSTVNFGAIGLGAGYAVGAARAAPGRPVLLVAGDGGFMLGGLAEFNSAVRDRADLIVLLCNDGAYGAEHVQFRRREMAPGLAMFDWPDFAALADALGGRGYSVSSLAELDSALAAIPDRKGPILIDVKLDPDTIPQLH